jgi:hypothetical protein
MLPEMVHAPRSFCPAMGSRCPLLPNCIARTLTKRLSTPADMKLRFDYVITAALGLMIGVLAGWMVVLM